MAFLPYLLPPVRQFLDSLSDRGYDVTLVKSYVRDRSKSEEDRPKLTYLPFSAGAHHCIGETLAIFEMLVHLNRFARRFSLRRVDSDPVSFEALINLRATRPFIMRLSRRTRNQP